MFPSTKLVLVPLLVQENVIVHWILPIKHVIREKKKKHLPLCMLSLRDMPLFSVNDGGTRITLRSAFGGCADSAELALPFFDRFHHGCPLAVPRYSKQSNARWIPRRKGIPLLRATDIRA